MKAKMKEMKEETGEMFIHKLEVAKAHSVLHAEAIKQDIKNSQKEKQQ